MKLVITLNVGLLTAGMILWLWLYSDSVRILLDVKSGSYKIPLIKIIIKRYADCRMLDIKVRNLNGYVKRLMDDTDMCGLSYKAMYKTARAIESMIVVLTVMSALFFWGNTDKVVIGVLVGVLAELILYVFRRMLNVCGIRRMAVDMLTEYLRGSVAYSLCENREDLKLNRLKGRKHLEFMWMNRVFRRIAKKIQ